ncbi:MAG: Spo0E family sporulation regulatory protein-aspartic acid phosphatase [Firmicutes bacterium]|nr:Spo0E family sporulation regulatory protein-aspartic acid phosphatase [Bacillota bacterium]
MTDLLERIEALRAKLHGALKAGSISLHRDVLQQISSELDLLILEHVRKEREQKERKSPDR